MEPSEFNDRLDDLIEEARKQGLHVNHIQNGLESQLEERQ